MFYEKFQKEPISFNCALFWTAWWNLTSSCSGWGSPFCPVHLHRTCYLHVGRLAVSVTNRFSYWLWERQGDTARETSHSRNCHNSSFALFDVLLSPPVPTLLLSQQRMYRRKKHSMYKVWSHPVSGTHWGSWKVSPVDKGGWLRLHFDFRTGSENQCHDCLNSYEHVFPQHEYSPLISRWLHCSHF